MYKKCARKAVNMTKLKKLIKKGGNGVFLSPIILKTEYYR